MKGAGASLAAYGEKLAGLISQRSETAQETEFMGELEAASRLKPAIYSSIMLYSIAAFIALFVLWASFLKIDEITHAEGQVVPTQEIQVVQSLEGGVLADLPVAEGEHVTKGQVLMRISDVAFSSEQRGTEARFTGLAAKKARLQAESSGAEFVMPADITGKAPEIAANETALYKSRQQELANAVDILEKQIQKAQSDIAETQAQIERLSRGSDLQQQELEITQKMVSQQAVSKLEEIRLRKEMAETTGQLAANRERLDGLKAALSGAQKQREDADDKFRSQALGELNEVETQIAQLKESLKSIGDRVYRAELRAPVDGIINSIAIKTIGGIVEPAHKLIEIVPIDDELKIVARVRPTDIAFLRPDQRVMVKISAYDPQLFGRLEGRLARIAANSNTDREGNPYFEIEVRTDKNHLGPDDKPLPVTPGMVASVDVITGKRTIMHYLLKPILRARDNALTER